MRYIKSRMKWIVFAVFGTLDKLFANNFGGNVEFSSMTEKSSMNVWICLSVGTIFIVLNVNAFTTRDEEEHSVREIFFLESLIEFIIEVYGYCYWIVIVVQNGQYYFIL